jgi:hypothetical protein
MNGIHNMNSAPGRWKGLMKWPLLCVLLGFMLARTALATDSVWPPANELGQVFDYTVPGNPPPIIDATNFDIENQFTINFTATVPNPETFETWNTINYTNNGLMVANAPLSINGVFLSIAPGCGFLFDTQTTNVNDHQMAGTFYNPGSIRVNSIIDNSNDVTALLTIGEFDAWATNIVNPGTIDLGPESLLQLTGQIVKLARSQLTIEGYDTLLFANPGLTSVDYGVGTDTNADWIPGDYLQPTYAISSFFTSQLFALDQMEVFPSIPYYHQNFTGTNYVLTRAVFLTSTPGSPGANVTQNVYFGGNPVPYLGNGFVTVQWTGSYIDQSSGQVANNYLYLNDYYVGGANTNNPVINGIPSNFTFTESATPAVFGVAPAVTAYPAFNFTVVTNNYSYVSLQFVPSTVATNATLQNPSGALSNLVGRVQISATSNLDLGYASIDGPNYLSISSPNQFSGSAGAQIFAPYADINVGVTNGNLSVSNLLEGSLPRWSGNLQAWSSDWIYVDANSVTNEYRVLLVNSQLSPTAPSQVQNLRLHATNNLVISDTFNIIGSLSIDATNLTLTTNGVGAGSPDGELNLQTIPIVWATAVPNVRNLTNNGAIRTLNLAVFGGAQSPYYNFISSGLIMDSGAQIWADNFNCSGTFSNVLSANATFALQSTNAVLTNLVLAASGDVSINTGSLVASNVLLQAGRSLTLLSTNLLTDQIVSGSASLTNGNIWTVGAAAISNGKGLSLPLNPTNGDLLGTTITSIAPANVQFTVTWAGNDYGAAAAGFTNNAAVGRLILNGQSSRSLFTFNGTGVSNAMYVDYLEFDNSATNETSYNYPELYINTNMVVYFAQAYMNGVSVAEKIDEASRFNGRNNGRLIWVPTYAGHFSSTSVVSGGVTNTVNAALASSQDVDSNGNGIPNASDPTPFFLASQIDFMETLTNVPPLSVRLSWMTIPLATNYVYYRTNLISTNWMQITNFTFASTNYPVFQTNSGFTLTNYPSPATNISILDPVNLMQPRYYRVAVLPYLTGPNGY